MGSQLSCMTTCGDECGHDMSHRGDGGRQSVDSLQKSIHVRRFVVHIDPPSQFFSLPLLTVHGRACACRLTCLTRHAMRASVRLLIAGEEDMEKMRLPPVGGRQMRLESQCGIGAIFGICLQAATDVVCDASSVEAGLVCPSRLIGFQCFCSQL